MKIKIKIFTQNEEHIKTWNIILSIYDSMLITIFCGKINPPLSQFGCYGTHEYDSKTVCAYLTTRKRLQSVNIFQLTIDCHQFVANNENKCSFCLLCRVARFMAIWFRWHVFLPPHHFAIISIFDAVEIRFCCLFRV